MSQVYYLSDPHFGHKNVIKFEDNYRAKAMDVTTIEQHDEKIYDMWAQTVTKRDTIYVLGDLGYNISNIKNMPGYKILLLGNHDKQLASHYLELFDDIIGPIRYKKFWLGHIPMHPDELWGKPQIHGHTHAKGINDSRYINISIEMTGGAPLPFRDILSGEFVTWNRVNYPYGVVDNSVDHNPDA